MEPMYKWNSQAMVQNFSLPVMTELLIISSKNMSAL